MSARVLCIALVALGVPMVSGCLKLLRTDTGPDPRFRTWVPGTTVELEGVIANVTRIQTSYGEQVELGFGDAFWKRVPQISGDARPDCRAIRADPTAHYEVGQRHTATLHLEETTFNGVRAVTAPELVCPFPGLFTALGVIVDSASWAAWGALVLNGTDADGWSSYDIVPSRGLALPAEGFRARLGEMHSGRTDIDSTDDWVKAGADGFVNATRDLSGRGLWHGDEPWRRSLSVEVDRLDSFSGISVNGLLRYRDHNANGLVDDGDKMQVQYPPIANGYQQYMLELDSCGFPCAGAFKLVLQGPQGPYERIDTRPASPQLGLTTEAGPQGLVSVFTYGRLFGNPAPIGSYSVRVHPEEIRSNIPEGVPLAPAFSGSDNVTGRYMDRNSNGLADTGDEIRIVGAPEGTHMTMMIVNEELNQVVSRPEWVVGKGFAYDAPLRLESDPQRSQTVVVRLAPLTPKLDFANVTATLQEGEKTLVPWVEVAAGGFASWAYGEILLRDLDHSGTVTTGDEFTLEGAPSTQLRLDVRVADIGVGPYASFGPTAAGK